MVLFLERRRGPIEGIGVTIARSNVPAGTSFAVNSQALGSYQPTGTGAVSLNSPLFFDISVQGISDGTATVSITNDAVKQGTKMVYWYHGAWVSAGNQYVKGKTVSGDIPVAAMGGTPIAIGT